jgi:hypothetical protein
MIAEAAPDYRGFESLPLRHIKTASRKPLKSGLSAHQGLAGVAPECSPKGKAKLARAVLTGNISLLSEAAFDQSWHSLDGAIRANLNQGTPLSVAADLRLYVDCNPDTQTPRYRQRRELLG